MAKPASDPTFATDAAYAADGDPWGGDANKVDPGAARRAEGVEPDTFPAEWFNHHMNALGEHIEYVHDVLAGDDTIPDGSRSFLVPLGLFTPEGDETEWERPDGRWKIAISATPNPRSISCELGRILPDGANLTQVRALVDPGQARAAANNPIELHVESNATLDLDTPNAGAWSSATYTTDDNTADLQTITHNTGGFVHSGLTPARILIKSSSTDLAVDYVYAVEVTITDPGPRNF